MADSPGGTEVGRVSVRAVPDTSSFAADLQADLDALEQTLRVNIPLTVDTSQLDADVRTAVAQAQAAAGGIQIDTTQNGDPVTAGSAYGTEFAEAAEAALRALPPVTIDADTTEADLKIAAIRDELELLGAATIGVDISDDDAVAKLAEIKAALVDVQLNDVRIDVAVDATEALVELAVLDAAIDDVTRSRSVNIDTGATEQALSDVGNEAENVGEGFSKLVLAGIAIGPALIPILAVVLGGIVAIGAALGPVVAGLAAFAIVAVPLAKVAEETSGLEGALEQLRAQLGTGVLDALNAAFGALAALLPDLVPLIQAVITPITELGDELKTTFQSGPFQDFIAFLSGQAAGALGAFGQIVINLGQGFAELLVAFAPVSDAIINGLLNWSQGFANIGQSNGLATFIAFIEKEGPAVVGLLEQFGDLFLAIVKAATPLGELLVPILTDVAKALTDVFNIPGVGTFIATLASVAAAAVLLAPLFAAVAGAVAFFGSAAFAAALPVLALVAIFALVVVAVVELADHFTAVQNAISSGWDAVYGAVSSGLQPVVGFFEDLPGHIVGFFEDLPGDFERIGEDVISGLVGGIEHAFDDLVGDIEAIPDKLTGIFKSVLGIASPSTVFAGIGADVMAGLDQGLQQGSGAPLTTIASVAGAISDAGSQIGGVTAQVTSSAVAPTSGFGGSTSGDSAVFVLKDADGVLLGTIAGVAAGTVTAAQARATVQQRKGL